MSKGDMSNIVLTNLNLQEWNIIKTSLNFHHHIKKQQKCNT